MSMSHTGTATRSLLVFPAEHCSQPHRCLITGQFATLPSKHNGVNAAAVMLNPRDQRSTVAAAAIASQFAAVNNHHPTSSFPLRNHCRRSRHCINPRRCSPSRQLTSWVYRRGWSCQLPPIQSLFRLRIVLTISFCIPPAPM
jgi:hypothetical protein